MENKAMTIIEEVYEISLNPGEDYLAQMQSLAPSGELGSKISLTKLLFKLCKLIDTQQKEIAKLQKHVDVIELVGNAKTASSTRYDPESPLQP